MASVTNPSDPSPQSLHTGSTSASAAVGRSSQRSDLDPETEVAVNYLQQVCARAEGADEKGRFTLEKTTFEDYAMQEVLDPKAESFQFRDVEVDRISVAGEEKDRCEYANFVIETQLEKLEGLSLFSEDKEQFDAILDHMKSREGSIEDLQTLGKLLDKVNQAKYLDELNRSVVEAHRELTNLAHFCGKNPLDYRPDMVLEQQVDADGNQKHLGVTAARYTAKEDRQSLGERLAKSFNPLRLAIAKTEGFDDGATLDEFDYLISRLEQGDVRPRLVEDLRGVVSRGLDPDGYARDTIRRLFIYGTNSSVDGSKNLQWNDYTGFSLSRFSNDWNWNTREGAARFGQAIGGLRPMLPERSFDFFSKDLAQIRNAIHKEEEVPFALIQYLHGVVEQEKNPAAFAISELVRINEMARSVSDGKPITWRTSDMNFKMTSLSTKAGRKEAGERLYARLEPLVELCDPKKPELIRVKELLQTIKDGNGTSSVIKELTDIFVNLVNPPARNPPSKDASDWLSKPDLSREHVDNKAVAFSLENQTKRAGEWFDEWAESNAHIIDTNVEQLLLTLSVQVRNFHPGQFKLFSDQIGRIRDEGKTDRQTVRTLHDILRQARRAEMETKKAQQNASAGPSPKRQIQDG